ERTSARVSKRSDSESLRIAYAASLQRCARSRHAAFHGRDCGSYPRGDSRLTRRPVPYDVLMPQLGMTMTEGSVVQWLKKPGELVEKGEFLFIIQTDKVDIEVESPCSGTLVEVLVELEQVVPVGTTVGRIAQAGSSDTREFPSKAVAPSSAPASQRAAAPNAPRSVPVAPVPSRDSEGQKLANPRAKKLARELGLDISLVPDYEGRGRIVEADVQRFFQERSTSVVGGRSVSAARSEAS